MAIIGVIEAELQGSSRETSGGVGPLFRQTTVRAPFAMAEFLSRTLNGLRRFGDVRVVSMFVDDTDMLAEEEQEELTVEDTLAIVDDTIFEDNVEFSVLCSYSKDDDGPYTLSVEGSVEHPQGDPTFALLMTQRPGPAEASALAEAEEGAHPGELPDFDEPDVTWTDEDEEAQDGDDALDHMEQLLERLQAELDKELAFDAPDQRVWEEDLADPTKIGRFDLGYPQWAG